MVPLDTVVCRDEKVTVVEVVETAEVGDEGRGLVGEVLLVWSSEVT